MQLPLTPDRRPGPLSEEEINFELRADGDPESPGGIRYVDQGGGAGAFRFRDNDGVFDPRTGGSGITEGQHELLDTLAHWLAETNYQEVTRSAGKVTNVTNWVDSGKTTKIREAIIQRTAGKVSQVDLIQYDVGGAEKFRLTGVITRTGGVVSSIQWTKTVS